MPMVCWTPILIISLPISLAFDLSYSFNRSACRRASLWVGGWAIAAVAVRAQPLGSALDCIVAAALCFLGHNRHHAGVEA